MHITSFSREESQADDTFTEITGPQPNKVEGNVEQMGVPLSFSPSSDYVQTMISSFIVHLCIYKFLTSFSLYLKKKKVILTVLLAIFQTVL